MLDLDKDTSDGLIIVVCVLIICSTAIVFVIKGAQNLHKNQPDAGTQHRQRLELFDKQIELEKARCNQK